MSISIINDDDYYERVIKTVKINLRTHKNWWNIGESFSFEYGLISYRVCISSSNISLYIENFLYKSYGVSKKNLWSMDESSINHNLTIFIEKKKQCA